MTRKTVHDLLRDAENRLREAGIDLPSREARLLLTHALGLEPAGLIGLPRDALVESGVFERLLDRRCRREPMAFLTGRCGFWTLDLAVSPDTLIPRADSETLIEAVLAARPERGRLARILDLGTGTGCLLLAALSEYPAAFGVGIDLSAAAASLASRNAAACGLAGRSAFLCGEWDQAIDGRFDLVLSNPPYIPSADLCGLMPEVRGHEPARALDGGGDGLAAYRALMPALDRCLAPGGLAVLEIGIGQLDPVLALARSGGLCSPGARTDLGGVARAVLLQRPAVA